MDFSLCAPAEEIAAVAAPVEYVDNVATVMTTAEAAAAVATIDAIIKAAVIAHPVTMAQATVTAEDKTMIAAAIDNIIPS